MLMWKKVLWSACSLLALYSTCLSADSTCACADDNFYCFSASDEFCCNAGWVIYGDYLYWQASEDQQVYAGVIDGGLAPLVEVINNGGTLTQPVSFKDQNFKWNSGYRIGIGYLAPNLCWDVQFYWTSLHQKVASHTSNANFGIFPLNIPLATLAGILNLSSGFASLASSSLRLQFDTLDFEFGKKMIFWDCLSLHPYVGIKGAAIKQRQSIDYSGFSIDDIPLFAHVTKQNDFHGAGPRIGVDAAWSIYEDWSVSGGIGAALLYGKFQLRTRPQVFLAKDLINTCFRRHKRCARSELDAHLSIDWSKHLCAGYIVGVGIGYEFQYWWSQYENTHSELAGIVRRGSSRSDLMLHGLTVQASLSF